MKSISLLSFAVTALLLATSTPAFSNGGLPDDMPADCPNSNVNPCPDCPDGSGGGGPSSQPDTKPSVNTPSCLSAPCNSALREGLFGGPTKSIYKSPQNTPGYAFASSPDEGQMGKRMIRVIRQDAHLVGNGGMALQLTRIHNNINVNHGLNTDGQTGFGPRWYSNHDIRIGSYGGSTTSNIYLRRADGGMTVLYYVSPNKWETNPSQGETLYVDQVTTGYHMRTSDPGLWYEFNTDKQLTKIRFPNGNMLSYAYDGAVPSKLSTVSMDHETSDTDNRYLLFSYTTITYGSRTRDRISAVTIMPANTVAASYEYDSHGMLYRVKNKHGEVIEEYTNSNVSGLPLIAEIRAQNRTGGVSLQRKYTYQNQFEVFQVADGAQRVFIQNNYGAGTQFYALTTFQLTADGQAAKADGHSLNFARTPVYSSVQAPNSGPVVSQTSQHFRADTTWQAISDLPKELVGNNGTTTSFEYVNDNPTGNDFKRRLLKKKTAPDGKISEYEYDAHGRITRAHDNRGNDARKTYDTKGNVSSATDAVSGLTSYYFYDVRGNKTRQEGPTSTTVLTWTYDGRGNLLKSTDAEQFEKVRQYNANDQLTTLTSRGQTVKYLFDLRDRATTSVDTLGNMWGRDYDTKGFLVRSRDALGNTTLFDYNTTGMLNKLTHPDGSYQMFEYDFYDKLTTHTDARGHATGFEYDWKGRKTAEINPLGHKTQYVYADSGGCGGCSSENGDQIVEIIDPSNRSTYFGYDVGTGRLTKKSFSGMTEEINYVFDAQGRLTEVQDERLSLSEFGSQSFYYDYDAQDRLTSETYPDGAVVSWTYDNLGRRHTMTDPENNVTTYSYNDTAANKKMASISHSLLGVHTLAVFDNQGRLQQENYANGAYSFYNYDVLGNLFSLEHDDININPIAGDYLSINAANRPVQNDQLRANHTRKKYNYDKRNQLISEDEYDISSDVRIRGLAYNYDKAGNRLKKEMFDGATTITVEGSFNAYNQLTTSTQTGVMGTTHYAYDSTGNLTSETVNNSGRYTIHDRFDRLVRFHSGSTTEVIMIYDYNGRLLQKNAPDGSKIRNYYDGTNILSKRAKPVAPGTQWRKILVNALKQSNISQLIVNRRYEYVFTTSTIPLGVVDRSYHYDKLGNVICTTNESGLLAETYNRESFGTVYEGALNAIFYSAVYDDDLNLYQFSRRWYNSMQGLFTRPNSPYSIASNSPSSSDSSDSSDSDDGTSSDRPDTSDSGSRKGGEIYEGASDPADHYACREFAGDESDAYPHYPGLRNALRHCIWQCCLTAKGEFDEAVGMGKAHEVGADSPIDTEADLHNNQKGRGAGSIAECEKECPERCHQLMMNGRLDMRGDKGNHPEGRIGRKFP